MNRLARMCRVLLVLPLVAPLWAGLQAGVARRDVTPPPGAVSTWGYGSWNSKDLARGVLDPLYAHILYVRDDLGTTFAWVDFDFGRTPGIPTLDRIRTAMRGVVNHVFFSATHTHSGPFFFDDDPSTPLPAWEQAMVEKVEDGIRDAANHASSVNIGFAYGTARIGYNRRLVRPDGTVEMLSGIDGNNARVANGPVDDTFAVLRLDSAASGQPLAVILNATAHPVIRKQRELFSADYPGVVRQVISSGFASNPECLFLQGGAGDINPQRPPGADPSADDGVKQLGELLGQRALETARSIPMHAPLGSLRIHAEGVPVAFRWPGADFVSQFSEYRGYVDHFGRSSELPMVAIVLDDNIGWIGVPGEFFVQLQQSFRERSPLRETLFAGYSNGYFGYFPTIEAAASGGYGANNIMAAAEVGAGERLVDRALIWLDQLLGRLKSEPAVPHAHKS